MVRHSARIAACVCVVVAYLGADSAAAQPSGAFGVGWSLTAADGSAPGFTVNASKDLTSGPVAIGPIGDFSLHRDSGITWTAFGGGIRATGYPAESIFMPFGEFLVGASVLSGFGQNETALTFIYGGGVHLALSDKVQLLVQFDLMTATFDGLGTETGKRTMLGISVPLGVR